MSMADTRDSSANAAKMGSIVIGARPPHFFPHPFGRIRLRGRGNLVSGLRIHRIGENRKSGPIAKIIGEFGSVHLVEECLPLQRLRLLRRIHFRETRGTAFFARRGSLRRRRRERKFRVRRVRNALGGLDEIK